LPFPSAHKYDNHKIMARSIGDNQKKGRGRPATGITPMAGVRLEPSLRAEIETWAEEQEDAPNLAEAMRRLIKIGLSHGRPPKKKR
jgi:hypothetical protein